METLSEFLKTLKPGDIITTVGCKGQKKGHEDLLVKNGHQHEKWGRYARVTEVAPVAGKLRDGDIGIRTEGISPTMSDVFWTAFSPEQASGAPPIRKATESEHRVFMEEYLKVRIQINTHNTLEIKAKAKQLRAERASLNKIAKREQIDIKSLEAKK